MCPDAETLKTQASWDGSKGTSREKLLLDLQKYIPPTLMVPDNRLEILLNQAITWQRMGCLYHDQEDEPHSLYVNHMCDQAKFPNKTTFILREHTNEVWYLDFANSGQYLASASKDSTIIIWNTTTFHPVHILTGHEDAVNYVAWSPDDKWLLSCSSDKTARLWNAETGTTHHIFTEGPDSFSVCVWLPCSTTFLTAGIDQCIRAWNIYGHCLYTIDSHRIYDMAVKSDGSQLIVASDLKKIHVYDLATKSELYTIQEHESITSFKISKDDRYILCNVHNSGARLWDLETRDRVQTFTGQKQKRFVIRSCFGGNNQSFIISGSEDGQVYVWHRNKSVLMYSLPGHTESVNCVAWNHQNDSMFASASDDNTIRIWNSIVPPTKPLD
jgi:WD40 repeat protein